MEKKYLRKFGSLFDCLPDADEILSGKHNENQDVNNLLIQKVSSAYIINRNIIEDTQYKFLKHVFDEIDNNLYQYPLSREDYIKDLLRVFINILPYLDPATDIEWVRFKNSAFSHQDMDFPAFYGATLQLLVGLDDRFNQKGDDLTEVENYVLSCSALLFCFSGYLDSRCLHFDLDLFAIQTEINIFICRERDIDGLFLSGYEDKLLPIMMKEKPLPKALPGVRPLQIKTSKSFPDHLMVKKPLKLAAICEKIFNRHESPKDYAIMLCLLVEHKFIAIQNRGRSDFFRSWYTFINRPVPNNFEAENKHIDIKDGFCFYNDNDLDYKNLKMYFNKSLQDLGLS